MNLERRMIMDQILTLQETSKLLKISDSTLRSWIKKGKIPVFKLGHNYRIRLVDIENKFKKHSA